MTPAELARLDAIEARITGLETSVDAIDRGLGDIAEELTKKPGDDPATAGRDIQQLAAWVEGWLLPTFRRSPTGGTHWCPRWWGHGEAVLRLAALHASWQALCGSAGSGTATWLRDFLDPGLAALLGESGPFIACKAAPRRHELVDPLTCEPLPADLPSKEV